MAQRSVVPPWETPSWFKLFRHVDADGSGLISYGEFAGMVRDVLKLPSRALPERRLRALCGAHLRAPIGESPRPVPLLAAGVGTAARASSHRGLPPCQLWERRCPRVWISTVYDLSLTVGIIAQISKR